MKLCCFFACLTVALVASSADVIADNKIALVNGTLINPGTAKVVPNALVMIDGDHITSVGQQSPETSMKGPRVIDCKGKFILPGYIDTHVHFFQSGGLFTRPDGVDLTSVRPYKDEVAMIKRNLSDTFTRYLRSGITSVVDIGGPMWNFEMRKLANAEAKAPRVAAAGPLISSVSRPQLDLGDPPIVKIDTPEQGREMVRKLAAQKPDYIKIWYIVPPAQPAERSSARKAISPAASPAAGQSDVERAAIFRPVVHAVIEESHARKLRVAVHATELEAARASVEEGADLLVHSVTDKLVDDAFVKLLKEHGTILTPTLVVFERYGRTFANKLNLTPEEKAWGNPEVIASLDVTKIPADKMPDRIKTAMANPDALVLDRIQKTYDIALKNLKTLEDAGVTIAAGTDAGNIGTIHGPALFREFQLMKEAGLTPMQILQCTTGNAAKVFGGEIGPKIGAIKPGNFADLVILKSNPVDDIKNASDIDSVMKNGVLYPADTLLSSDRMRRHRSTGILPVGPIGVSPVDPFQRTGWKPVCPTGKMPVLHETHSVPRRRTVRAHSRCPRGRQESRCLKNPRTHPVREELSRLQGAGRDKFPGSQGSNRGELPEFRRPMADRRFLPRLQNRDGRFVPGFHRAIRDQLSGASEIGLMRRMRLILTCLALAATAFAESPRTTMKAIVAHEYGGPEVLKYEEAQRPEPKENDLLVRVIACGVNPADPLVISGRLAKEFGTHLPLIPGYDVAGVVEKTGAKVTKFKNGAVYGYALFGGGWAEYAVLAENEAALKPKSATYADAAAVPLAALTAWQALVDVAKLSAGQTVLIHGGSGGVGSFAKSAKLRSREERRHHRHPGRAT